MKLKAYDVKNYLNDKFINGGTVDKEYIKHLISLQVYNTQDLYQRLIQYRTNNELTALAGLKYEIELYLGGDTTTSYIKKWLISNNCYDTIIDMAAEFKQYQEEEIKEEIEEYAKQHY